MIFVWWIQFDLVLLLGSKVTCFLYGGSNWPCAGRNYFVESVLIDWLGFRVGGGGRNQLGFWTWAANRLVLVLASILTWFMCGWSILTWFQCGGSNLTWFQFSDRNCFFCVSGRKWLRIVYLDRNWLGFCVMMFDRSDMESWQVGVLVMFCKTTQSPLTEHLSSLVFINEQKRHGF